MELEAGSIVLLQTDVADGPEVVSAMVRSVVSGTKEHGVASVQIGVSKLFKKRARVELHAKSGGTTWFAPCQVTSVRRAPEGDILDIRLIEAPQGIEHRAADRVDTLAHGVTASIDGQPSCLVADVSEHGMAIITRKDYAADQSVHIQLEWKGRQWAGEAIISRVAQADSREASLYGVKVPDNAEGAQLLEGLARVCATVQIQHQVMAGLV